MKLEKTLDKYYAKKFMDSIVEDMKVYTPATPIVDIDKKTASLRYVIFGGIMDVIEVENKNCFRYLTKDYEECKESIKYLYESKLKKLKEIY